MIPSIRETIGYAIPAGTVLVLLALTRELSAVGRFLGATVVLLAAVKVGAWLVVGARTDEYELPALATLLFWTVWPGVRPDQFAGNADHAEPRERSFVVGYAFVAAGALLALAAVIAVPHVGAGASSWLLLFGVLSVVHAGVGRILPFCLRWLGVAVPPLFDDPLASRSVGAFWSERWNRPFVEMNRLFVTRPLAPRVGIAWAAAAGFLVSGVLHELAISYTAGGGWGTPMLYFAVQGAAYTVEQRWFPDPDRRPVVHRLWTYAVVVAPLPLLFHAPFRSTFLIPLVEGGRALLLAHPLSAYVGAGLWVGAAGHFLVLVASYRVPDELDWETDLASLDPFNRKLLWTYGGFIVMTILAFGLMTAAFHAQLVAGTPVALGLAAFVAVWWTARVLVDGFYYDHDDWPEGVEFVVGHTLLTSLFVLLVVVYGGTVAYHLLGA